MPTAAKLDIWKAVAVEAGYDPPASLTEDSDFIAAMRANYPIVVNYWLSRHGWSWATETRTLYPDSGVTVPSPWAYQYQLPVDRILVRFVEQGGFPIDYDLRGEKILTEVGTSIDVTLQLSRDEGNWPPVFVGPLVKILSGPILRGLADEFNKGDRIERIGRLEMLEAIKIDKRQKPGRRRVTATVWDEFRDVTGGRIGKKVV